jgi:2-methylcitrate dehydratase PrpD
MADETLSEKLARHNVALQFDQIPVEVIDAAKLHILDSIGCLLAGTRLEPGRLAYDMAIATSGNRHAGSSLFGIAERVSYADAVQAMSTAAHCGEMDDIHGGAGTCIGAMIIPALLAMAEKFGGSGRKFIEAATVSYETVIRVGLCIDAPKLSRAAGGPVRFAARLALLPLALSFSGGRPIRPLTPSASLRFTPAA